MRVLVLLALCLALCGYARAFVGVAPSFLARGAQSCVSLRRGKQLAPSLSPRLRLAPLSLKMEVEEKELIKVFGRLAEKTLFGDGSAGACCHSGCDNCEWRSAPKLSHAICSTIPKRLRCDVRYSFDVLQSARPKWIPAYSSNKFDDGREHIAKWSSMFEDEKSPITKQVFAEKLAGYLTAKQADLSEEAVNLVWEKLSNGKETVSVKQMSMRLRRMVMPGEDGIMWSDFLVSVLEDGDGDLDDLEEAIVVN